MSLFLPTYYFNRITDIPISFFKDNHIKGLLLDVDNTLTTHDNPTPLENLDIWLNLMRENNIKMMIVSNNHIPRVEPFSKLLNLDFVADGKKPLTKEFNMAIKKMNLSKNEVVVIGDQIFTDILGGNLFKCKTILLNPIQLENTSFFKFKRALEKPFISKFKNKIK